MEKFKLIGEELIPVIKERERAKKAEELRQREESEKTNEAERWNNGGEQGNEHYS